MQAASRTFETMHDVLCWFLLLLAIHTSFWHHTDGICCRGNVFTRDPTILH